MAPRPEPTEAAQRLDDLSDELRRTYDALLFLGSAGPGGGVSVEDLIEQVPEARHELEYQLNVLESRGLVRHGKVGSASVWSVRQ